MHKKVEDWIDKKSWNALMKTKNISDRIGADIYSISFLKRLHVGYMKFLKKAFPIITIFSISFSLLYIFPVFFHVPIERMILVTLVIIFVQLRYGNMKVKIE
jgi:hypothetical protein